MILGDAVKKFETFVSILVHSLISVQHKSIKLGQMIHLNMIFHVVVSNDYGLVNI